MTKTESSTIKVQLKLPFYLQLEKQYTIPYLKMCSEKLSKFKLCDIAISFINKQCEYNMPHQNTTIIIRLESSHSLTGDDVNFFVCRNCLEIINRVIMAYHAATGSWVNAGFINPIGLTEIQLNAEIFVNRNDFRDRKPFHSFNSFPLEPEKEREFEDYLGGVKIPLPRLLITNAILLLEQGQYSLSALQSIIAIEVHLSNEISEKLKLKGKSQKEIDEYLKATLGEKLLSSRPDDERAETYWSKINGFPNIYTKIKSDYKIRNDIAHKGYIASKNEARNVVTLARDFIKLIP
jgi:hypothetical protein